MEIKTDYHKRCAVVKVAGRIDSATAPHLQVELTKIMDENIYNLVLHLSDVTFISSAGLRVLITTQKTVKKNRGDLALAMIPENILAALDLAGFTNLFNIFDDEVSAVGSF
jgi:anti-sigma B factor antagonist